MPELGALDRCAAYAAARGALAAVARAARAWPSELAEPACTAAIETVMITAESHGHDDASAQRRRCLRAALAKALELAATCDVAGALGHAGPELDRVRRRAGRAIALLGLQLHAHARPWPDDA